MADQLAFIQTQLWIVMGLFAVLVVGNFICMRLRRSEEKKRTDRPQFGTMWEKDQLDELLSVADHHLREYPNSQDALYFSAKALMAKGRFSEARPRVERFQRLEPTMKDAWQPMLDTIDSGVSS